MTLKKKAQIGIFVVISVILIILFIFIASQSNSDKLSEKQKDLDKNTELSEIFPLKETIDVCLENALKKATLTAGLKGGLIYNQGEEYIRSNGINYYDPYFLTNFGLDINYLSQNLVHSKFDVFIPKYDDILKIQNGGQEIIVYNHTIIGDFEKFILIELADCIDFSKLVDQGFTIEKEDFFGKLQNIDFNNNIVTSSKFGKTNDLVLFIVDGTPYYGNIISSSNPTQTKIQLSINPFSTQTSFADTTIINLGSKVELDVQFEDESITATLKYPIFLEKQGQQISFKETSIKIQNRFKKLLELGQILLNEKVKNRQLDIEGNMVLSVGFTKSPYFSKLSNPGVDFLITVNEDELDYKLKTISLIDNSFKLYSNPYVMNFGLENHAPNLTLPSHPKIIDRENMVFKLEVGESIEFDLGNYVVDKQLLDNYQLFFEEVNSANLDYSFRMSTTGYLRFRGSTNKITVIPIKITDGETISDYTLTFEVGSPNSMNGLFNPLIHTFFTPVQNISNIFYFNHDDIVDCTLIQTTQNKIPNPGGNYSIVKCNPSDSNAPTHIQNLNFEFFAKNEHLWIENITSTTEILFTSKIIKNTINMMTGLYSNLVDNRGFQKTNFGVQPYTPYPYIIDNVAISTSSSQSSGIIEFIGPQEVDGKMDYINIAPEYSGDLDPIEYNPINITNRTSIYLSDILATTGDLVDLDQDELIINYTPKFSNFYAGYSGNSASGSVYYSFSMIPPVAGTYTYSVWATDKEFTTPARQVKITLIN